MKTSLKQWVLGASAVIAMGCNTGGSQEGQPEQAVKFRTARQGVLAACPYTEPTIDMDKSLVIKHLSVVNDACRTKFSGSGAACASPNSQGKWSFGYLMSQIAGNKNAADTSAFILNWLSTWQVTQNVNGFSDPPRPGITNLIVNTWRTKSGCALTGPCTLDFNQEPFRLLAIVNRVDLSGPFDFYNPNAASPGELRFAFGFVNLNDLGNTSTNNGALRGTVILEYKLTPHMDTFSWAYQFHNLSNHTLGTEAYNNALEQLTTLVTRWDAGINPNGGSALGQVRTNEIAFDTTIPISNRVWELREQSLDCAGAGPGNCSLKPDTVKLTIDDSFNKTGTLDSFMLSNAAQLAVENFSGIPPSWIAGASRSKGAQGAQLVWDLSDVAQSNYIPNGGSFDPLNRHHLGLANCNGCHYVETNTSNFHIFPRAILQPAATSGFVGGSNALEPNPFDASQPNNFVSVTDPVTGDLHSYNDSWRRKCEMQRLLNGDPTPLFRASGAH